MRCLRATYNSRLRHDKLALGVTHMLTKRILDLRCIAFAAAALFAATATAQQNACDRTCLGEALDAYLDAVTANDPSAAPLFVGFRQTENAVVVRPGGGMWASATGLGSVQRHFFDPVSGQAAFYGVIEEGDRAAIVSLRLKVVDREITEAEWYIGRQGDPGINGPVAPGEAGGNLYNLENLIANPPPDRTIPRHSRTSRAALIAITNSYFDGITTKDGSIIMAHPGCVRNENGVTTTGRPVNSATPGGTSGRTDCTSNMASFNIPLVAGRRYPLVDEEAGVVLGLVVFIRAPGSTQRRNGLSEFFFIDDNKISSIYAAMFYPAADAPVPNWPPFAGNWPLPASMPPK